MSRGLYRRTGCQDCCNVWSYSDHHDAYISLMRAESQRGTFADYARVTPRRVVLEAWGNDDDAREAWLAQVDLDDLEADGIAPDDAYKAWRDGWLACAESKVAHYMRADEWFQRGDWQGAPAPSSDALRQYPQHHTLSRTVSKTPHRAMARASARQEIKTLDSDRTLARYMDKKKA